MSDNTKKSVMQQLLKKNKWKKFQPMMDELQAWPQYPVFLEYLAKLDRSALYVSPVHGEGHIERTLLHGAFCAMADGLDEADTRLLLEACSYHDVGRVNDWLDNEHGYRSSLRLEELTGRTGDDLAMLRGAVHAHSLKDELMEETVLSYHPADPERALRLAALLKDADGLDRVRIHDLKTRFLRREASKKRADFALFLYADYERRLALNEPYKKERVITMNMGGLEKEAEK